LFWLLSLALIYTLFGFFGAPRLLKLAVLWQLPKQLGRPVTVEKFRVNPFTMSLAVVGFQITEREGRAPFVRWDEVSVNFDPTGLFKKEFVFAEVGVSNAFAAVQLNRDGTFNFSDILNRFPSEPKQSRQPKPLPPVRVGQFRVTGTRVVLNDLTRARPFQTTVGPIDLTLRDFTTHPRQQAPYSFTAITEAGETLAWRGYVHLSPLRSAGEFAVGNVALPKYAPIYEEFLDLTLLSGTLAIAGQYQIEIADQLTVAQLSNATVRLDALAVAEAGQTNPVIELHNLTITGLDADLLSQSVTVASLQTTGDRATIRKLADGLPNLARLVKPLPPAPAPAPSRPWQVTVRQLRSTDHHASVTGYLGEESSRYQLVQLTDLQIVTEPLALTVEEILVVEPRLDVRLPADTTLAWPQAKEAGSMTNTASEKPLPFARVGAFVVSNATVTFTDETITPVAGLTVTGIAVRVTGFSTATNGLTDLEIRGRIDNTAPFEVTGRINPFSPDAKTALRVAFTGINLVPASPYAGKYAGYLIRKGAVSLGLEYDIQERVLKASNSLVVDQFTFGEATGSPDATKLPVKLAVAILKDRHGQIKLDVPIEGRVDDPQFRYWGAVWTVVGNLFTKIFTAPFSFLGSMFGGGGEELGYQEFAPGSAQLQSNETRKLDVLIQALTERPALNLELTGSIDPVKDREPLQRAKLRALALARAEDYATGLRLLYAEALAQMPAPESPKFSSNISNLGPKSRPAPTGAQAKRTAGDTTVEEIEARYLPLVELTPADYRQLTTARVASVVAYLKETGRISDDRLFVSSNPNLPVLREGARVVFGLQ
jgi:hypothetical protein